MFRSYFSFNWSFSIKRSSPQSVRKTHLEAKHQSVFLSFQLFNWINKQVDSIYLCTVVCILLARNYSRSSLQIVFRMIELTKREEHKTTETPKRFRINKDSFTFTVSYWFVELRMRKLRIAINSRCIAIKAPTAFIDLYDTCISI